MFSNEKYVSLGIFAGSQSINQRLAHDRIKDKSPSLHYLVRTYERYTKSHIAVKLLY